MVAPHGLSFVVTAALVAWLVAATVVRAFDPDLLARAGALLPSLVLKRPSQAYRLVTHAFVPNRHLADPLFAAAATWTFGPTLESALGARRFAALVGLAALLSGVAAMSYGFFHPTFRAQPAHGVSTIGFALAAAFAARWPDARLRLFRRADVRARTFVGLLTVLGIGSVLLSSQEMSPAAPLTAVAFGALLVGRLAPSEPIAGVP